MGYIAGLTDLERVLIALAAGLLVLALLLGLLWGRSRRRLAEREAAWDQETRQRLDKSRSVLMGQVAEHLVPLLAGFPYQLKDARFLGQPVDYLVFDGLEDGVRCPAGPGDAGSKVELVFCEIKTGQSRLSPAEQAIREAVQAGRVRFEVLRLGSDGILRREDARGGTAGGISPPARP